MRGDKRPRRCRQLNPARAARNEKGVTYKALLAKETRRKRAVDAAGEGEHRAAHRAAGAAETYDVPRPHVGPQVVKHEVAAERIEAGAAAERIEAGGHPAMAPRPAHSVTRARITRREGVVI